MVRFSIDIRLVHVFPFFAFLHSSFYQIDIKFSFDLEYFNRIFRIELQVDAESPSLSDLFCIKH